MCWWWMQLRVFGGKFCLRTSHQRPMALKGEDGRSRRAIHPGEIEVVRKVFQMYLAEPTKPL
jgi:hypothetical protein